MVYPKSQFKNKITIILFMAIIGNYYSLAAMETIGKGLGFLLRGTIGTATGLILTGPGFQKLGATMQGGKDIEKIPEASEPVQKYVKEILLKYDISDSIESSQKIRIKTEKEWKASNSTILCPPELEKNLEKFEKRNSLSSEERQKIIDIMNEHEFSMLHEWTHCAENHERIGIGMLFATPLTLYFGTKLLVNNILPSSVKQQIPGIISKSVKLPLAVGISILTHIGHVAFSRYKEYRADCGAIAKIKDPIILRSMEKHFNDHHSALLKYYKKSEITSLADEITVYTDHPRSDVRAKYCAKAAEKLKNNN